MRALIFLLFLNIHTPLYAVGVITLKGKIQGFNSKVYIIQTENFKFHIEKNGISISQSESFKKIGAKVNLQVPMSSVVMVKPVK